MTEVVFPEHFYLGKHLEIHLLLVLHFSFAHFVLIICEHV